MKFEIPYNFDKELVKQLIPYREFVDFVYMPAYYKDGGNSRYQLVLDNAVPNDWNEYLEHLRFVQSEFEVGILLQRDCTEETIAKYYNLGVKIFTINNHELATKLRQTYNDLTIILSITAIPTLEYIKSNDLSMYDEIVLFFNFARQQHLLAELPDEYKYVLIPNSHCLYKCQNCLRHWYLTADTLEDYFDKDYDLTHGHCADVYREDRAFIPPQDLSYFNNYIYRYKLTDRLDSTEDIIYNIDRYSKEYDEHRFDISWFRLEE